MSSGRREYWIIFLYTLVKDGETSWQHPFLPPVKVKHRPVFGRTQQGGFLSVAASNYRQTVNIKENPSYSWEGSLCLCSHDALPSDAAALVNNWKAACCSFKLLQLHIQASFVSRRLCLPHPVTSSVYLSPRWRVSGEPHFCWPRQPDYKVEKRIPMNFVEIICLLHPAWLPRAPPKNTNTSTLK